MHPALQGLMTIFIGVGGVGQEHRHVEGSATREPVEQERSVDHHEAVGSRVVREHPHHLEGQGPTRQVEGDLDVSVAPDRFEGVLAEGMERDAQLGRVGFDRKRR